jgi:predicted aldo/keto reductase-like oxidoreductase
MQYRPFGMTGFEISALGFGAMRLPMRTVGTESEVDEELAIPMIHRGFELGINYIDTAYFYCGGKSEVVVGKALKGWRDSVRLSTKLPLHLVDSRDDFKRLLDEQLTKLDTDHIDFYHFHGINMACWKEKIETFHLLDEMARAKDEGTVRHASFSFHDKPEHMRLFADSGAFSSVLCQYNFLDRTNEESIAYVAEKGLGVVAMGPVGGGRLAAPMGYLKDAVHTESRTPELALRFVLSNPHVSCALSGMSAMAHVEENVATASRGEPLSEGEVAAIETAMDERKELAKLYCTGCRYCMPCPHDVDIPACFQAMITDKVYGFTTQAEHQYDWIAKRQNPAKQADGCTQCGVCESKCPQHIPIREQLKEVAVRFSNRT